MPRSPLALALSQLAARHRAADALVGDPDDPRPSRRGLLAGAGAVSAALAVGELPGGVGAARAATASRLAVVGAGISGLAAALRLQDAGVASTVYEANTRVGGRMYSNASTWAS